MELIHPPPLRPGDTIGIFTPSFPAHVAFREKYQHGVEVLRRMGFRVVEGPLTARATSQGYRSGTPGERADEFMALARDPQVRAMIATIGGANSASLIPYLDFGAIRAHPKIICGYSDVTSLHLSVLAHAGVSTFYGPAVMPSFGEWPDILPETRDSFLDAVQRHTSGRRSLRPPARWSNHFRDAKTDAWRTVPREYRENPGWRALVAGEGRGPLLAANLSTLMTAAGTDYFPDLDGRILMIESMNAPMEGVERQLRHLERLGAFERISGLLVSKSEFSDAQGAPFGEEDLLLEVIGSSPSYPVVTNFDCGHTNPMLTLAEGVRVRMVSRSGHDAEVVVEEPMTAGSGK